MNGNDQGGKPFSREMVQGEWKCSECGAAITELPFQPSEGRPVYCKDCYRNRPRNSRPNR